MGMLKRERREEGEDGVEANETPHRANDRYSGEMCKLTVKNRESSYISKI